MLGSTEVLPEHAFDVAVMTSHVAQFFDRDGFARALADLHRRWCRAAGWCSTPATRTTGAGSAGTRSSPDMW